MLSIRNQLLIDQICDQAEAGWKAGVELEIAELIGMVDETVVPALIHELIRVDLEVNKRPKEELQKYYLRELPSVYGELVVGAILGDESQGFDAEIESAVDGSFNPREMVGKSIGNYRVDKILGVGGFGMVYRAKDKILNRHVVIKLPRGQIYGDEDRVNEFLDEAKNIAHLRHPNILNVLHVGKKEGQPYIVEEYFEDGDLGKVLQNGIPELDFTLKFVFMLAEAIQFANQNGIIHRDLKPANILVGLNGEPIVGDFGLSLHAARIAETPKHIAGTVQYMSPEQIRGETHRLDGRADIWSIGVILYRMLTGRLPFDGKSSRVVADQIIFSRPVPPQELRPGISEELNRICMRCLSQRVNGRYESASELGEDLERLINNDGMPSGGPVSSAIRSKGLSAFGNEDRDFFLSLLPSPLSRDGFPECIDFWKRRIENVDLSQPVGLIFGPSGCGKSSLVRAGLLPALSDELEVVTVDATAADTEVRLLKGLRARFPDLPNDVSLPVAIAGLREKKWMATDRRLLIVIDQFEQWLRANSGDEHPQLVHAIRHCDGENVMAMVLVREDFFSSVSQFFNRLDIDLIARKNFSGVALFDSEHAKHVLVKFGQALGKLPPKVSELSPSQHQFLDQAVEIISEKDLVMCVRLAIFVETFKKLPWNIRSLQRIGDAKEIGAYFLEQILGEDCKNPKHRFCRNQMIKILEQLLPGQGVEIKGSLSSRKELAQAAGMSHSSPEFKSVLSILDNELRLISPTNPDGEFSDASQRSKPSFYQLTHDYLVPSIREWLHYRRGQSRSGRARLRLQELAAAWQLSNDSRFMPGFFEYASIVWHVPHRKRAAAERTYMARAGKLFGARFLALATMSMLAIGVYWHFQNFKLKEQINNRVNQFLSSKPAALPLLVERLKQNASQAIQKLELRLETDDLTNVELRRVQLGLSWLGKCEPARTQYLVRQIPNASDSECSNFIGALGHAPNVLDLLETEIGRTKQPSDLARLQIVRGFLDSSSLLKDYRFSDNPDARSAMIHEFGVWHGDLHEVVTMLDQVENAGSLAGICLSLGRIEPGEMEFDVFEALTNRLLELYSSHYSAAVHSASKWALESWQIELPNLDESFNRPLNEWWINKTGITMLDFWFKDEQRTMQQRTISACEVPASLYAEFLNDPAYPGDQKPQTQWQMIDPCLPTDSVNLNDAVLFCNWLSARNGMDVCYKKVGKTTEFESRSRDKRMISVDKWELIEGASGYRLPWIHEWELAASGGTTADFFHTDSELSPWHNCYQWNRANSPGGLNPVGKTIPNQFGLFDVMGNVAEICWGTDGLDSRFFTRKPERFFARCGGSLRDSVHINTVRQKRTTSVEIRQDFVGLRVILNERK